MAHMLLFVVAPVSAVIALLFAFIFYKKVMTLSEGTEKMVEIAEAVRQGAKAYIKQQYKIVAIFFVVAALFLAFLAFVLKVQSTWTPFAFLTGGFFSGLAGFIGMITATLASARTTNQARESLGRALKVAFRSGAVMGLVVVGLALVDISLWFIVLHIWLKNSLVTTTVTMLSFGMGASLQALFARVGGGIYTKAADVGADLVGKVEQNIPEDDPRNPATIADNVGDNVGDVAGMGADLYESYAGSILASAALGASAILLKYKALLSRPDLEKMAFNAVILPMVIAGVGILASILGIFLVRTKEGASQKQLLGALGIGVNISSLLIIIGSLAAVYFLLPGHLGIFGSIVVGLVVGLIIGKSVEYYTSDSFKPTREVADKAKTGEATVIIGGMASGMISTSIPVIAVAVGILGAFAFAGGFKEGNIIMGLYGIGVAAVGMLSTLGITLATDAYGPIADNAGGNAEMSGLPKEVRKRTDALDSLGNTTAATGKGFAIGSAALTALALLAAYIEEVKMGMHHVGLDRLPKFLVEKINEIGAIDKISIESFMEIFKINLMNPKVIVGVFLGAMMAFMFSGLTMKAVGRAASRMVDEVRRQFREIKGIWDGTAKPDYQSCVQISIQGAQKEMILPSSLAIVVPIATGVVLGVSGVMGLLIGALGSGFILAIFMANAGGTWDNAKKYIEQGNLGGKGSPAHKAGVVGDTVGDPLKDTSGPSLNILIKLMSMISIVVAGLTVGFSIL
ncbi:MAG: sodium-translocating pyrophosphatase [Candidatus Aminicenantes bacterium]|nr:sodium-translocating pyrophosphatase [Candidatus Aminicenantes bacterium]NIM84489.1 sodium-translocating pyrophosphatase [Candidatus Aminicenantes bacterium]NIN24010.1 sodium-translocating pyrophosphatase [Candidatus Aminicenantes bacterium]NIN47724.1 sodium-translocating pyrophosphatase [Candidatus Aminicenantes bacterium]NIN90654.1 sodium-translocating pyrophosphatase [Candidatus Aminicenantes bacterium]